MRRGMQVIFGGLLMLAIVAGAAWGVWALVSWFLTLPSGTQTATAALIGVVSVPLITYFTSRALERRRSRETAIREKKTELYDGMIVGFMRMLNLQRQQGGAMPAAEMLTFFADLTPKLLTYGDRRVILAWTKFRRISGTPNVDPLTSILAFDDMLKAVRGDLGHPTLMAGKGELVRTFVIDLDVMMQKRNPQK
ncbi:hypothetical protein [Microbacterium sp. cx-59]|uniref:hypothetical protein n=1 Tax=Microbacterium sp. cx-59 TaxID=2891207 RepID=UPI001E4A5707|nr:hypothetical protein [Microbacterium sp. cx-59]MCC4908933.1 hypothetical protein [Microbacterium sp. cx-59]